MYRSLGLKRHRKPHPSLFELVFFITCPFQGMGAELPHPQPYARVVGAHSRDVNKQGDGTGGRLEQCRTGRCSLVRVLIPGGSCWVPVKMFAGSPSESYNCMCLCATSSRYLQPKRQCKEWRPARWARSVRHPFDDHPSRAIGLQTRWNPPHLVLVRRDQQFPRRGSSRSAGQWLAGPMRGRASLPQCKRLVGRWLLFFATPLLSPGPVPLVVWE